MFTCVSAPGEAQNPQWLHVDQNAHTGITHECYQGVLYLWHSEGEDRSTTVVWPGSHKADGVYGRLMEDSNAKERGGQRNAYGIPCGHYVELNHFKGEGRDELVRDAVKGSRRIPVPAGSLLLWSSRTVHQGWKGGPRLAIPICWEPKERVSEEARKRKALCALAGFPTNHSPSEGLVHPCVASRRGDQAKLCRPQVRPFSVLPEDRLPAAEWAKLWNFWEGEQFAEDLLAKAPPIDVEKVLKPEVIAAL